MSRLRKPSEKTIKAEINNLRKYIESEAGDPLAKRLAQVAEDALRWSIEQTDWAGPMADVEGMANIIRNDSECILAACYS